jgi:hypothetical protein
MAICFLPDFMFDPFAFPTWQLIVERQCPPGNAIVVRLPGKSVHIALGNLLIRHLRFVELVFRGSCANSHNAKLLYTPKVPWDQMGGAGRFRFSRMIVEKVP